MVIPRTKRILLPLGFTVLFLNSSLCAEEPKRVASGSSYEEQRGPLPVKFELLKVLYAPALPDYPPAAKNARVEGTVIVSIMVDEAGNAVAPKALSGPSQLWHESVWFASRWKFEPFLYRGSPVRVQTVMKVVWKLPPPSKT
ncbi:energy transducer TonB [Geothrix limicola]|uniref:energy transducer TonB n=1 Tax=Geothrix limicola TaxID=2927978 RepID=UPI003B75C6A0